MTPTMRRVITWVAALLILGTASLAVGDLLIVTDDDRIDQLIDDLASARHKGSTLLRAVDLGQVELEISIGRSVQHYRAGDDQQVLDRATELDDALGSAPLEVRQREITVDGDRAHVIVNLDRGGELHPCDVTLRRAAGRWLLERVRVMA